MKYALMISMFVASLALASISPGQALNNVRVATEQVPLIAKDHRILEQSFQVLQGLVEAEAKAKKAKKEELPKHPSEKK
jgi:hypothetical protein